MSKRKNKSAVLIQKIIRGYLLRKKLKENTDSFSFGILNDLLDNYISYIDSISKLNKEIKNKKIRNPNFPSEISENIVKYAILKKYGICPLWDIKNGDLKINKLNININKTLEVKAFSSNGPTSFGPTECWDYLYFVDAINFKNKKFIVYELKLSNNNSIFRNLKVNKKETFNEQCINKRRPRIVFSELKKQLNEHIKIIFNGSLSKLK